jgi:hypothetical protein
MVSRDAKKPSNFDPFQEFFANPAIQAILHTVNMVLERLDPYFAKALIQLKNAGTKRQAQVLAMNPCHMIGLAIHWNQDGEDHEDGKSLNSGQDFVIPVGKHRDCRFEFKQVNAFVDFDVTDMGMLRGGGMKHGAKCWKGQGRMVLVPFVEKQLFHHKGVPRPWQFKTFYHQYFDELRRLFPATPL